MRALLAAIILSVAPPALAEVVVIPGSGMTVDTPDGWTHGPDKDGDLQVRTENGHMQVRFKVYPKSEAQQRFEGALKGFHAAFDEGKLEKPVSRPLNGMDASYVTGVGTRKGIQIATNFGLIEIPSDKVLLVMQYVYLDDGAQPLMEASADMMRTLKPTAAPSAP